MEKREICKSDTLYRSSKLLLQHFEMRLSSHPKHTHHGSANISLVISRGNE